MIIDFHNHYFPPEFLDAVRSGPSNFRVTEDQEGNPVLHSPGDYNVQSTWPITSSRSDDA